MAEGDIANEAEAGIEAAETARGQRAATERAREELASVDPEAAAEMAGAPTEADQETRKATKQEKEQARKNTVARSERTYTKERLISEGSDFLGHPPHVVAGALHDADEDELTIHDAKALVNAWLKREV